MTDEHPVRRQIVELAASLFQRGFSVGSAGNISVRLDDGFLMTPTNSSLGRLEAESLAVLNRDWEHICGPSPSKEVVMHRAMYEARPEAQAIVHLHSTYVTAYSCLAGDVGIPPLTPYFVMRLGREVPTIPYYRPGAPEMLEDILVAGRRSPGVVLSNHGSLVAGSTIEEAVNGAEELEVSAQLAFLLEGRQASPLSPEQVDDLLR